MAVFKVTVVSEIELYVEAGTVKKAMEIAVAEGRDYDPVFEAKDVTDVGNNYDRYDVVNMDPDDDDEEVLYRPLALY